MTSRTRKDLRPPRWATRLIELCVPAERREFVVGDLDEEFKERVEASGRRAAVRWYRRQAWLTATSRHRAEPAPTDVAPKGSSMLSVLQDVRYAVRRLLSQPGFTLAAILTLALGVGANAAVFQVAWQTFLKPLPFPHADRLVRVSEMYVRGGRELTNPVAPGNYADWRRDTRSFDAFAGFIERRSVMDLTGMGDPVQLEVRYVTGEYFAVFGMPALAGRSIDEADTEQEAGPVVLSEHLWRQRFGADAAAVGRSIMLTGVSHRVIGIMPEAFGVAGGATTDLWMSLGLPPNVRANHGAHYFGVFARLKPGVTVERAIADVQASARQASLAYPKSNRDTSATVALFDDERGGTLRSAIALLAGAAGFVLLIACANLASLQLARTLARGREFGIRTALGASRGRLVRQLLVESLVLSVAGSAAGLAVSSLTLRGLALVAPATIRGGAMAGLDAATIAWAALLALASASIFAVVPAWRAAQRATRWINQRAATGDRRVSLARTVLVTGQLALAVMLLVSATLLVTSLSRVLQVDPGFNPDGVLAFDLTLPFNSQEREVLLTDVAREVQTIPGVTSTCAINVIPFDDSFNMTYVPDGQTTPVGAFPRTVTPGCLDVLGLRLVQGRWFTDHETTRVGIVSESFARRAWKGTPALGQRVHLGVVEGDLIEIVGVVRDSLQRSLDAPAYAQFYEVASRVSAFPLTGLLARTVPPPATLFNAVRAAVRRVDPGQPVGRLRTLNEMAGSTAAEREFNLGLLGGFATIALVLSAVGIYGLFAHVVAERRSEIGIRMALGAVPSAIVRLMLRRAWFSIGLGLALGLAGALLISGTLRHLLFELSPTDPRIYATAAAVLGLVALAAAWLPSRRAARIDPVRALRDA